jgi:hypothetical protein
MGIKNFFRKVSPTNISKAFIKGGDIANNYFKKAENISNQIEKKAPGIIDTALRKTQNSLAKAAPIVSKIGMGAGLAAPMLAGIPVVGAGLAAGAAGLSASAPGISKGLQKAGQLSSNLRQVAKGNYRIEASKPEPEQESEMFGNMFA